MGIIYTVRAGRANIVAFWHDARGIGRRLTSAHRIFETATIYAAKPGYSSGADGLTTLWRGANPGSPDRLSFPS